MVSKVLVPTGEGLSKTLNGEDCNLPQGYWVCIEDIDKEMKRLEKEGLIQDLSEDANKSG